MVQDTAKTMGDWQEVLYDEASRSLQTVYSENKYSLLFRTLVESPGDLTKDDIAEDLWTSFQVAYY